VILSPHAPELAPLIPELEAFRRDLHAHPETAYQEQRTAGRVAERLAAWGLEVHRGLAGTGVVGVLRRGAGRRIGLRADLDALAMAEANDLPHRSRHPGRMHACGHDGHTAMLLGAARLLAARPEWRGTLYFVFQPAEENEAGGRRMVEEGLFDRFPMDAIFGLHNWPGLPLGEGGVRSGAVMASADFFHVELVGRGAHAAYPHRGRDPIVAAAALVQALQGLVSRETGPLDAAVVSVTRLDAGDSLNVIPERARLAGTVRALDEGVRTALEVGVRRVAEGIAAGHRMGLEFAYERRYRTTVNDPHQAALMLAAMAATLGAGKAHDDLPPTLGAEDFGWMLAACPGAYGVLGNGTEGRFAAGLHNPRYEFNDALIPYGVAFWVNLAEGALGEG